MKIVFTDLNRAEPGISRSCCIAQMMTATRGVSSARPTL